MSYFSLNAILKLGPYPYDGDAAYLEFFSLSWNSRVKVGSIVCSETLISDQSYPIQKAKEWEQKEYDQRQ